MTEQNSPQAADSMGIGICEHGNLQFRLYNADGEIFATGAFSFERGCLFVAEAWALLQKFKGENGGAH